MRTRRKIALVTTELENIYNLINFDLFDGVIVTPTPLFAMDDGTLERAMLEFFQKNCRCKVVALDLPFGDYEVVCTDDTGAFYEIARHIFETHRKEKVYFLTGHRNYGISEQRLEGFLNYAEEHDISVPEDHIFYGDFWLCMRENWLDLNEEAVFGYPDRMRILIHSQGANDTSPAKSVGFCDELGPRSFDRGLMLPEMHEEREEASVFYFLPVHAEALMYGYVAVRCPLSQKHILGYLFHQWIRFVSNALTMTRIKNRLFELSMKDAATGLYNRRGMAEWLDSRLEDGCGVLAVMADMDGLKRINDRFGHADGDFSLHAIAKALEEAAERGEICARIGGDEFLLVGVGNYSREDIRRKIGQIRENIDRRSRTSGKEYEISASLGYAVGRAEAKFDIDRLIEEADAAMYENKREKYKSRGIVR